MRSGNRYRRLLSGLGGALLIHDDFERANTAAGDLGTAPTGQSWSLRGPYAGSYPLPASLYGQITDGNFVVPEGAVVYAIALLSRTPKFVDVEWSWIDDTVGTQFTTLAVILSPSANVIDTMLHITVTNGVCNIQKRVAGGSFVTMNTGSTTISPSLALADTPHRLRLEVTGDATRVRIDDNRFDVTVTDAEVSDIVGRYFCVEHFSSTTDVRWPMKIRRVEARA